MQSKIRVSLREWAVLLHLGSGKAPDVSRARAQWALPEPFCLLQITSLRTEKSRAQLPAGD